MSNNRKCIVCGKEYEFCRHCSDNALAEDTWRTLYCDSNCKDIFEVLNQYGFSHIDAKETKQRLDKLDLSKLEEFREDLKRQIQKIRKEADEIKPQPQIIPQTKPQEKKEKEIVKYDSKKKD